MENQSPSCSSSEENLHKELIMDAAKLTNGAARIHNFQAPRKVTFSELPLPPVKIAIPQSFGSGSNDSIVVQKWRAHRCKVFVAVAVIVGFIVICLLLTLVQTHGPVDNVSMGYNYAFYSK